MSDATNRPATTTTRSTVICASGFLERAEFVRVRNHRYDRVEYASGSAVAIRGPRGWELYHVENGLEVFRSYANADAARVLDVAWDAPESSDETIADHRARLAAQASEG